MTNCRFCTLSNEVGESDHFGTVYAVMDSYPVSAMHWLVIPFRHCSDYFELSAQEKLDTDAALVALRTRVMFEDSEVSGFNIGWNCGADAGQTVMHAHAHLIPRRAGDVADPRGGVRGVIPQNQSY